MIVAEPRSEAVAAPGSHGVVQDRVQQKQSSLPTDAAGVVCAITSVLRPGGQGRVGPWPEERPEFSEPVAPSIDMQDLHMMEQPIEVRRRQDLIIGKDRRKS